MPHEAWLENTQCIEPNCTTGDLRLANMARFRISSRHYSSTFAGTSNKGCFCFRPQKPLDENNALNLQRF